MSAQPLVFDRVQHARRLRRAAAGFGSADFLKARAAEDLVARLEAVNRTFPVALDLGARTGTFRRALAASDAASKVGWLVETDLVSGWGDGEARVVADEERLPFAPESFDLVVSSLALHWVNDLVGTLIQIRRMLKPDGLMMVAVLGGATLTELRQSLLAAEAEARGGAGPRISPFVDAATAPDLLRRAGFNLTVVDVDTAVVRYAHPLKLMADLRAMGETAALADRSSRPLTRGILAGACEAYARRFADPDGRIPARFDIVTLTGWAPHPDQPKPLRPGSAKARLADALGVVEHKTGDRAGR